MSRYIPELLRKQIAERANFRCEYCLVPETNSFYAFQVDHIISVKHGGTAKPENLAYCCSICNRNKGTDLGTVLENPAEIIRFFNPRTDNWDDHFTIEKSGFLLPKSPVGEATIKILGFNHPDSVLERKLLISAGKFH